MLFQGPLMLIKSRYTLQRLGHTRSYATVRSLSALSWNHIVSGYIDTGKIPVDYRCHWTEYAFISSPRQKMKITGVER